MNLQKTNERRLTSREREILWLVAEGKSNIEIATDLKISVKTVDTHRTNLMRKLAIHKAADLVRYALRRQHLDDPKYPARGSNVD
jgi:DNA-binding NarL/FixJ family response regulator